MPVKSLQLNSLPKRAVLFAAVLLCLVILYFFAKWCFAYEIGVHSQDRETAQFAVELSPNEPQTHFALSVWQEKTFLPEDLTKSLAELEKATSLSPNDFRLWLALGRARERSGDSVGAENAMRKAFALAPNYSEVQWALGNFYFREGKSNEAFSLIRRAAETNPIYVVPAISVLWQIFDGDLSQIKNALGDSPQINASLAAFLAKEKRFDDAVEIWNTLPENEKNTNYKQVGDEIFAELIADKKFNTALKLKNRTDDAGKIFNGDFEQPIRQKTTNVFDWQISDGAQPKIGQNNETKHGGNASLFLIYNSDGGNNLRQIQQTVAITPGKTYTFECFYKADLKTSATLRWEIANADDGKALATTEAVSVNADWTNLKTNFTAPENSEAIVIRLVRAEYQQGLCPISGKVWFDDLTINK